jgi:superfamily I DNA/RNA helicase
VSGASTFESARSGRESAARSVVESDHRLRLIVAGPGTGKSYAFRLALRRKGAPGLALTFIKSLAAELANDLGEAAATYTFHAFSKHLIHTLQPAGLTRDFSLYPPLFDLMTIDLGILGSVEPSAKLSREKFDAVKSSVERTLQDLDEPSAIPRNVLGLGTYYDAASFIDLVYRVFLHLEANPVETPEYPLVVVDEYQDFTRLETAFIAQLGLKSPLLIAGDDDQALYGFRHASPEHIRNLAALTDVERHELPYCSRCTEVVVAAVNSTIKRAVASGHLIGRLEKPFVCFLPDKADDSARHPRLLDARCSIHRYMAKYVEGEISLIPQGDIDASFEGHHPTVLVVGPGQFVKPIYQHLSQGLYPQAVLHASERLRVELVDGYRRLARDRSSNLGLRILIHLLPFAGWEASVLAALTSADPLEIHVPKDWYRDRLSTADLLRRALIGEELNASEWGSLTVALNMDSELLATYLLNVPGDEAAQGEPAKPTVEGQPTSEDPAQPSILCTTLKGAKGLSAQHVFVVGLMNGHFPVDHASPSDEEISEFLVALSRTRKACHLVSTKIFAGPPPLRPSLFLDWVEPHSNRVTIDSSYWSS